MILAILFVSAFVILYLITTYNKLQTLKTRIKASIQEIGNQLKTQARVIPRLEEIVKTATKHEKGIVDSITTARKSVTSAVKSGDAGKMIAAQDQVKKLVSSLNVVVENYPDIKATGTMHKYMGELRDTEDKVMYARRTLIDLTADHNRILVTFPSNLVAKLFNIKKEKGLDTPMSGSHVEVSGKEIGALDEKPKFN